MTPEHYKQNAGLGIANPVLQRALINLQERFGRGTARGYLNLPEGPKLRLEAHQRRLAAIENLDILLERFAERIEANGGQVHFAEDAHEALQACLAIARRHDVSLAVKGKSMVSEEIGLNPFFQRHGIETVETDMGEYIVQLAAEHPSHIIAPAIHKTRQEIGRLFAEKLGIAYSDDPPTLTQAARKALRAKFLAADMGITGCNIACAQTGHVTTLSNEGNIRMAATLPRVHVVLMGMERITARLADHDMLFRLLALGAAAQNMAGYVSYVGGPRRADHIDGPKAFHVIIIDNGRSRILADPEFREALCCIRCGACLNICPVYAKIGGHAYGSAYSGPIGAVVTPLLMGINQAKDLCQGETLCGACKDACPVDVDLPRMLHALRVKLAQGDARWQVKVANPLEGMLFKGWSHATTSRRTYDTLLRLAAAGQTALPKSDGMLRRLPLKLSGWTAQRDLKPLATKSFNRRWRERQKRGKTP